MKTSTNAFHKLGNQSLRMLSESSQSHKATKEPDLLLLGEV